MNFLNDPYVWFALAYLAFVMIWIERCQPCASRLKSSKSDQKCPHCDKWQSEHGGWAWVGNAENPEIDFAAECGGCGLFSYWVWVGPGICATFEEVKKPKLAPTNFHDTSFINGGYVSRAQCPPLRNPTTPPGDE